MLKITGTLSHFGVFDQIHIMATWEEGLPIVESLDETRQVVRISRAPLERQSGMFWKIAKTLLWSWRIRRFLAGRKIDCINSHSLAVLPLCVYLKSRHGAKLIYDTHELETETDGCTGIRQFLSKFVEKKLIRYVDEVSVVSESIAQWYRDTYSLNRVHVIRNVPYRPSSLPAPTRLLRDRYGIADHEMVFLYHGTISEERGVDLLLRIFARLDRSKHIVFMGFGNRTAAVTEYAARHENIHYQPAVPPDELLPYTCGADIGIHLIKNTCLNHYYCLPNKIWEYLNASLPVLISDLYEMGRLVDRFDCGWKCKPRERDAHELIQSITWGALGEKKKGVAESQRHFGWQLEEAPLLEIYKQLGWTPEEGSREASPGKEPSDHARARDNAA
ncbi:MAG: glycosyltransferase [Deltaproteobacteria bacterium]|nr:glycosyltransferase [Deltaproteobacteria bacterium]